MHTDWPNAIYTIAAKVMQINIYRADERICIVILIMFAAKTEFDESRSVLTARSQGTAVSTRPSSEKKFLQTNK